MIQERWNLDVLYKGLDDPQLEQDFSRLEALAVLVLDVDDLSAVAHVAEMVRQMDELTVLASRIGAFLSLRLAANTGDTEAEQCYSRLALLFTRLRPAEVRLEAAIAALPDLEALLAEEGMGDYRYVFERRVEQAKHSLAPDTEQLIAELNITGGSAWSSLFDQLTANLAVPYEDKVLNLSAIRNLAYSPNAAVRESAYKAELAAYKAVETPLSFALSNIKRQVKGLARRHGFADPLDETLFASRMSKKTLDALLDAMHEKMPVLRRYLLAKAKYLGHQGALPWWDIFAPVGEAQGEYSLEEAKAFLVESFAKLHQPIADLIARAFDEAWIDFLPRPGKVGGAFCYNLPFIGQSRVLSNYDGTFNAVDTLAHELGHAYHGYRIEGHRPQNRHYTMPVAETASIFNETHLTMMALDKAQSKEEKLAILEGVLMNITQTVCDIDSRFRFEQSVFERCEQGRLTPEECCNLMHQAQVAAYGEGVSEETLHPYMWACKGHYYSEGLSYYNFPYAFGSLFAMGLYSRYLKEGPSFMQKYDELLTLTTVASVEDTAKSVGIDVTDKAFWLESLSAFEKLVEQFEALVG